MEYKMSLIKKMKKIIYFWREYGVVSTIKIIIKNLFCYKKFGWYEKKLLDLSLPIKSKIDVKIDFVSTDEVIDWIREKRIPGTDNSFEIEYAQANKHYFPGVKYNDKIIGFEKIGFGKIFILDFEGFIHLPDKAAMIYDTFILPEYRNLGMASFLTKESLIYLKNKGFEKIYCHILPTNESSIRSFLKVGFKKIRNIYFFKILGMKFIIPPITKMINREKIT